MVVSIRLIVVTFPSERVTLTVTTMNSPVELSWPLSVAYRFTPSLEVRAQLAGVELNLGSPLFDPRFAFGLQAAYRFF